MVFGAKALPDNVAARKMTWRILESAMTRKRHTLSPQQKVAKNFPAQQNKELYNSCIGISPAKISLFIH
jgi:hypothetical protein